MHSQHQRWSEVPILRFAAVGVLSTTTDLLVYRGLYPALTSIYLAIAIGFFAGLTVGFFLNTRYVFAVERNGTRYFRYALISLGGLLLTEGIIHLLYKEWLLMGALAAKLVAVGLVFFWNYYWSKRWAFQS